MSLVIRTCCELHKQKDIAEHLMKIALFVNRDFDNDKVKKVIFHKDDESRQKVVYFNDVDKERRIEITKQLATITKYYINHPSIAS